MEALYLAIAVGGLGAGAHLFHPQGLTQPRELTLEFSAIVCAHPSWHPKCLEHFLLGALGYSGAAFVRNGCNHHKLTEAANCH